MLMLRKDIISFNSVDKLLTTIYSLNDIHIQEVQFLIFIIRSVYFVVNFANFINVMAKLCIISLLIMLYVHYCFGMPTGDEFYNEEEVRILYFLNGFFVSLKITKIIVHSNIKLK